MPEEKKDKKVVPFVTPGNEAKKDSFTFSDKIKNSKPAGSKSFANRISSKIGSDGKPKKTLFERTKRDAPFFIAAIVALLLLPFLYKYSGSVTEPDMVTPGLEGSEFDPTRSGFDTLTGDPEGQIAQLAGRDSMDLIVGFGKKQEEESDDFSSYNSNLNSGLDDSYSSSKNNAEEYNTTNIYRQRKQAAPATRAAFKKTNINPLRGAGLTSRGGGKLGVGMWGGGLKRAADKVKADAPKSSPKPVSLQPLQAAGKPSRSYFGQGAAAEARRSKDAMSKANAMQALMDAQMKPIEPGKIGGIGGGDFGGPGGGNGNLDRKFAFNGKEPWWWDMMKKRSQMEWEAKFNRKWDWIKWGDKLAQNILGGIINCLVTGNDDGDPGTFFGTAKSDSGVDKCCGRSAQEWSAAWGSFPTSKKQCESSDCGKNMLDRGKEPWEEGAKASPGRGFFAQRVNCLSNGLFAKGGYGSGAPQISENASGGQCADLNTTHNYSIKPEGEALKWHTYHYIVARNYLPLSVAGKKEPDSKRIRLCSEYSDNLRMRKQSAAGAAAIYELSTADSLRLQKIENMLEDLAANPEKNKDNIKKLEQEKESLVAKYAKTSGSGKPNNNKRQYTENADPESLNDACVVYVAESEILDWERGFKPNMIDMLEKLIQERGISAVSYDDNGKPNNYATSSRKLAEEAFEQLDLYMIAGMSSKYKIGTSSNMKQLLPMPYWKFQEAFLERRGTTTSDRKEGGWRTNVSKRKHRQVGIDTVFGAKCYFDNAIKLSCKHNSSPAQAQVTFTPAFQASRGTVKAEAITLKASYYPGNSSEGNLHKDQAAPMPQIISVAQPTDSKGTSFIYTYSRMLEGASSGKATELTEDSVGTVKWDLIRGGTVIKTVSCDFNNSGDSVNPYIPVPECTDGAVVKMPETKIAGQCQKQKVCSNGKWGKIENVPGDADCEGGNGGGGGGNNGPVPPTPTVVSFYDSLTRIPQSAAILQADSRPGKNGAVSNPQWSSCKLASGNSPLLALDAKTKEFIKSAKQKFDANADNKKALITLEYNENALTIANLVDAIMIDPNNGTVPANTVCLLGKTIGTVARDPQASSFDNLFGAFLSFINYDAASFPSRRTYDKSHSPVVDLRFKSGTDYWWGGYVRSGNREDYVNQVNQGVWKEFPLKELARTSLPAHSVGKLKSVNDQNSRVTYHTTYQDLMQAAPCQYNAEATVQRANVLRYISLLCAHGDQQKIKSAQRSGGNGSPTSAVNTPQHQDNHNNRE